MKISIDRILAPLNRFLTKCHVSPNMVTTAGVFITFMVPFELFRERWFQAGFWLLLAGFFDVLDGSLARYRGFKGSFGSFWDSTLDRVSEAVVFMGFLLYYYHQQFMEGLVLAFAVLVLSFLVPYTRARAEGLGINCEVGILPRPGRVILLSLGLMAAQLTWALALVGILSLVTVIQRVARVWKETQP